MDRPRSLPPARVLLRSYALAWAAGARKGTSLRASSEDDPVEVAFVDPFAGADHPLPPLATPLSVSVLAALLGRAGTEPSRVRAVLLEEDPVKVKWLLDSLRLAELGGRTTGGGKAPPEIEVVEGGWEEGAPIWPRLEGASRALALVDPTAAGKSPLDRLHALLHGVPALDLLLRFPVADLRRLAGFGGIPLADLPPFARRAAEGISRLLGDPRRDWAVAWTARRAAEGDAAAEAWVADVLAGRLRERGERRVRVFCLGPPAEQEIFLLASADPASLLLMNEVVFESRSDGSLPWPADEPAGDFVRFLPRPELDLFGGQGAPEGEARDRMVDVAGLAHSLAGRFAGRRVTLRAVLESVAGTDLFAADVRRALGELRKDGRALYRSLARPDGEVAFPRRGEARPPTLPRPAGRPADEGAELLLDLDSDDAQGGSREAGGTSGGEAW